MTLTNYIPLELALSRDMLRAEEVLRAIQAYAEDRQKSPQGIDGFKKVGAALLQKATTSYGHIPQAQISEAYSAKFSTGNPVCCALSLLGEFFFTHRRGFPALKDERLLEFQILNSEIWVDQLFCFSVAHEERDGLYGKIPARDVENLKSLYRTDYLPTLDNPLVDGLRRQGLADIHRHMNGSALPSMLWLDLLRKPSRIASKLAYSSSKSENTVSIRKIYYRLRAAHDLRNAIINCLFGQPDDPHLDFTSTCKIVWSRLAELDNATSVDYNAWPFLTDTTPGEYALRSQNEPLVSERLFLHKTFRLLLALDDSYAPHAELLAFTLHAYLILQNMILQELAQPKYGAKGFDRFDEYSQSPLREYEKSRRLDRLIQAYYGGVHWLEARLKPKENFAAAKQQLNNEVINLVQNKPDSDRTPQVGVIFHFIREKDRPLREKSALCPPRHALLRRKLIREAKSIANLRTTPPYSSFIAGLDVANSEMNARPEVFAPAILQLRTKPTLPLHDSFNTSTDAHREIPLGLTYHAGEDFRHLLSGLRTIDEAIIFLQMGPGDRIGHGLAVGIDPKAWLERTGGKFYIPKGEWLDNLVWFRQKLSHFNDFNHLALNIESEILCLSRDIYSPLIDLSEIDFASHKGIDWKVLFRSWQLRARDPLRYSVTFNEDDKNRPPSDALAFKLWMAYHRNLKIRKYYDDVIPVEHSLSELAVWAEAMIAIQDLMLKEIAKKRIAIEINPSSNITIGAFDNLVEHPVFRWLSIEGGNSPQQFITVGSDDPGIFTTELIHEYAYLACAAERRGADARQIREWIEDMRRTSLDFCFIKNRVYGH